MKEYPRVVYEVSWLQLCVPQIHVRLEFGNVTLFDNRVFANVVSEGGVILDEGGPQIQWLLSL